MARTGIDSSDVKRARDHIVAQGRRPSIDAIRAALGDTGSKSTIHKFLRELDAEETSKGRSVSGAILDLANQLGEQLERDANVAVEAVRNEMAQLRAVHVNELASCHQALDDLQLQRGAISRQLAASEAANAALQEQLQAQQIARHKAEQHSVDLGVRLADAQQHQASLEDKHRDARNALEQFQIAAREQRDQETRRHAQQLQAVQAELREARQAVALKHDELSRLNKESAALVAEIVAGKQAAFLDRENIRHLTRQVARVQAAETRVDVLEAQLKDSRLRVAAYEEAATQSVTLHAELQQKKSALEAELAKARVATGLEERLAKLDQAVFGGGKPRRAAKQP